MRSVPTATYNALVDAPETGIVERNLVTFFVRSLDGESEEIFPFWNDLDTVTLSVIDGVTAESVDRDFVGSGALISVDKIILPADLTVQTTKVVLSQIHATVQNMVRGWDIRGAQVQIHRILFDPATGLSVGDAMCHMVGRVNKAPINTPATGEEGNISISVVSQTRDLTRTNPAKKSDETQQRRSGDRGRRYVGTANVKIWWGQKKEKVKT